MGRLLSGSELTASLEERDHIFRAGSWDRRQIQGAGYDLRLAGDLLVLPTEPGQASYRAVDKHTGEVDEFILAPGDSALISTIEKCSFGFDISGTIGSKFRWAAKGLLILHGAVAHPGYGRMQSEDGHTWIPKDLQKEVRSRDESLAQQWDEFRNRADRDIRDLEHKIAEAQTSVDRVNNASNMVVVFGVFLVATTILGFALSILIGLIERLPADVSVTRIVLVTALAVMYAASCAAGITLVAFATRKTFRG